MPWLKSLKEQGEKGSNRYLLLVGSTGAISICELLQIWSPNQFGTNGGDYGSSWEQVSLSLRGIHREMVVVF